ncbi:hypothetical protein NDU88_006300 [Pleurodeles waltl]|uniref:Uncharacterized protein n=1 Tax=Pleurodeles waltl TaxID=8319 RepID=A0AAV7X274_PLEWA|nr:hypothetical protein NDU88_006300 [Pleurodeles waltl]
MTHLKHKTKKKIGERMVLTPDGVFQNEVRPEEEKRNLEKPRRDTKETEDKRHQKGAADAKGKELEEDNWREKRG